MHSVFNTYIHPEAEASVAAVLRSGFLSEGDLVKKFEKQLQSEFSTHPAVALNSGTSALHLALVIAGIGEGDEVIIPAQTFVATGLAVLHQKAVPVFADINYTDGNIDLDSVKTKITSKTKAIMPVHWGGYPCDMDAINDFARNNNLIVIEDAAHALGAVYKSKPIGGISDLTCFSFQAIKHLTTGDGGALCCATDFLYGKAMEKRWFGINRGLSSPSELGERVYDINEAGYKYHMNDFAAALGLANLTGFEERMKKRRAVAEYYSMSLKNVPGITLFNYHADRKSAFWLFGFHVEKRKDFIRKLKEKNIAASVVHQRIDRNSVFGKKKNDLPNQEKFDSTQIHIPMHDAIATGDAEYIVNVIKEGW